MYIAHSPRVCRVRDGCAAVGMGRSIPPAKSASNLVALPQGTAGNTTALALAPPNQTLCVAFL